MPQTIGSYQVSSFIVPANLTTNDADQVRGNDNTLRAALNSHDGDVGIHFQGSTLAERPAAGAAGRKWLTTDDGRVFYDDGSNWNEISYLPLTAGLTITVGAVVTLSSALGFLLESTGGTMQLQSASAVQFRTGGDPNPKWSIGATGHITPLTAGVYDLGSAAFPCRTFYSQGATTVISANGDKVLGTRHTGWTSDPTGTLSRLTFVSDSVTLPNLAARLAALIVDLRDHGMLGA